VKACCSDFETEIRIVRRLEKDESHMKIMFCKRCMEEVYILAQLIGLCRIFWIKEMDTVVTDPWHLSMPSKSDGCNIRRTAHQQVFLIIELRV
jgi:hypothetical protein